MVGGSGGEGRPILRVFDSAGVAGPPFSKVLSSHF